MDFPAMGHALFRRARSYSEGRDCPRIPEGSKAGGLSASPRQPSNACDQAKSIGDGTRFPSGPNAASDVLRAARGPYLPWIETSSTSKIKVAFGGITLPAPRSP